MKSPNKVPDVESHGRRGSKFTCNFAVPEVKDLVVILEKGKGISYLFVSARIRVIDPFSQMKQEYLTIILRARLGSESIEHEADI